MKRILLIIIASLSIIACKNKEELQADRAKSASVMAEQQAQDSIKNSLTTAEAIAYASGLEKWNDVSQLQFTFNVDRGGDVFSRSWKWNPKTDDVTMMTAKDTVAYNRSEMDSIAINADKAFINDKYWLHAPFNLVWDAGTTITEEQKAIAPISKESLNKITVTYDDVLGYTPGDAYDLYYDNDFMVKEWAYRQSNQDTPTMVTSWEDYKNYGGLQFAQMHKDSTGGFKLYFTDIAVKTDDATK